MSNDTFYDKLTIKVDEPIMSLSMSPRNRDVCLGARKGLYIIDLDNCYEPPMFLPHVSAWEVADVQWSPHPSRAHWISSAAGGSALIWNLNLRGSRSPIEYTLTGHTRTVTDINFSVFELDAIATCSLDGQILTWDLRAAGRRPSSGFLSCNIAATQVKYSRQNPCLIASAHDTVVNLWDLRKASSPILAINAHQQRCYGLDFDRRSADRFVTCSLDRTIKYWSISNPETPLRTINTTAPVWRARNLPFGSGVLALPQRSETALKMYSEAGELIETYSGHTDVPKEFVWRTRGGDDDQFDDRQFQLVSWGRDRVLRTFPVSSEALSKAGHIQGAPIEVRMTRRHYEGTSFTSDSSHEAERLKDGQQSAPLPTDRGMTPSIPSKRRRQGQGLGTSWKKSGESFGTSPLSDPLYRSSISNPPSWKAKAAIMKSSPRPAFMTRSRTQPGKIQKTMAWMESVNAQMEDVKMSPTAQVATSTLPLQHRLKEEFTATNKAFSGRILFEKSNVAAGTCTLSCFAPHGVDGRQCFLKVHLDFPSDYPWQAPAISIEKSAELVPKQRAFLLTGLRNLLASHSAKGVPSLEAFARFLLGDSGALDGLSDSDSEDESGRPRKVNVPLPRRSGAVFGPKNELIVFFPFSSSAVEPAPAKSLVRTSRSPGPNLPRKTILFDSFGALSKSPHQSATDNSESDEALRLPRLVTSKPHRNLATASRAMIEGSSTASTAVYIRHQTTNLNADFFSTLSALTLNDPPLMITDKLLATYTGTELASQLWKLVREALASPESVPTPFFRVVLSKGLEMLVKQRDIFHLIMMLCVLRVALRSPKDMKSVKDSRTKPSARIKSPAPVVLSAHFRPSMPKSVRPSLVKFGEAHRKTERQAKKRVKITILPQETPELADLLDLPIDINYLLMFFAELCSRWQLWHMRAEILDLLSPSQDHPLFHQQLQLMSGLDPQHLSIELECPVCHNISSETCSSHTLTCTLCHRLARGLIEVCGLCLHGGHAKCMQTWFEQETFCSAVACTCTCVKNGGLKGSFLIQKG